MAIINEKGINANGYYVSTKGVTTDGRIVVFRTISERNICKPVPAFAWVIDATDDPTVGRGSAFYAYTAKGWLKIYETEMMDQIPGGGGGPAGPIDWALIIGKPTSDPAAIDSAVQSAHAHNNFSILNKIGDEDGTLTYNGEKISDLSTVTEHARLIAELIESLHSLTSRVETNEGNIENNATEITNVRTDLEQEISQVSATVDELNGTVAGHTDQLATISNDVTNNYNRINTLNTILNEISGKVTVAERDIQVNADNIAANTQTITDNKAAIDADQERQNVLINGLRSDLTHDEQTITQLTETTNSHETRIAELESTVEQLAPTDLSEVNERLNSHDTSINQLNETTVSNTNRIVNNEQYINQYGITLSTHTTKISDLEAAIANLPSIDVDAINERLGELNTAIEENRTNISVTNAGMVTNAQNISSLTDRVVALENATPQEPVDLTDLENRMTAVETELGLVQDKVSTLEDLVGV